VAVPVPAAEGTRSDDRTLTLELVAARGWPEEATAAWGRFPATDAEGEALPHEVNSPIADAIRHGEPVWLEGADAAVARYPVLAPLVHLMDACAWLAIPFTAGEDGARRVVGGLIVVLRDRADVGPEDRDLLLAMGRQCAQALERARLSDAARAAADERARLLAESERARAEAEGAGARSEAVLASIADAFYLLDRDWRFTYVNDAAEPLLQTTRGALLGRTLWEAFPGVIGSVFEGPYREAMATGHVTSAEAYFTPLDTWFDVRTYPWTGGLMVHFRDIGQRKAGEAERERLLADAETARREAEAANRGKSEFLAVMSHELRTPLNAIGGYAELMAMGIRGPVTEQQREDLGRIDRSQKHLLGLINEVLNYARLETGAVAYHTTDVSIHEALAEAEALVAPQARAKGLRLAFAECAPDLVARADAEKLRQVFVNLLGNAVKFTDAREGRPGRIELSCAVEGTRVAVRVRDTGIGIPADKLGAIFDPFVQVRSDLTRTAEGTGLGLAISRDLARGMGGDLEVESEVGVGSTFTLILPRA
jgi:signal transduction histidine kinase